MIIIKYLKSFGLMQIIYIWEEYLINGIINAR